MQIFIPVIIWVRAPKKENEKKNLEGIIWLKNENK